MMFKPKVTYDPETDALGIRLADHPGVEAEEVAAGVIITFDEEGEIVAMEVLGNAKELFAPLVKHALKEAGAHSKTS